MSVMRSRIRRAREAEEVPPLGPGVSRRTFLKGSSMTVAAAGLIGVVPGLPALISEIAPDAPAADNAAASAAEMDSGALAEPLVVQVKDVQSGEMSLYVGEREILYRDPQLASRILSATR